MSLFPVSDRNPVGGEVDAGILGTKDAPMRMWPVDRLHLGFLTFLCVVTVAWFPELKWAPAWLVIDLAGIAAVVYATRITPGIGLRASVLLRLGMGMILIPLVFTQVGLTLQAMGYRDWASEVFLLDLWLFRGTNPLEYLENWTHPWTTEVLQWVYFLYIPLIPFTVLLLALKGTSEQTMRSLFSLVSILYLSYVGYYLFPTSGPNIHNNFGPPYPCHVDPLPLYSFQTELPGVFAKEWLVDWMFRLEFTKWDCMPSAHVAVAIGCIFYAWRISRTWGLIFLFPCIAICVSAVYLRYHYVVDAVFGFALALVCVGPLEWWHRRLESRH